MKLISMTVMLVLAFASFSIEGSCQDFLRLREKAIVAVKTKRPFWKLLSKDEQQKEAAYNWGSVREGIRILIFYGESREEAAKRMDLSNGNISVGPGRKRSGFGDEAYSLVNSRGDYANLRFRKANVFVSISAPSLGLAEDLARDLAKSIRRK